MSKDLNELNELFAPLRPEERIKKLFDHFAEKDVLFTSSFGTSSVLLLHMLSKANPGFPVHLIDTGYLFRETHQYRQELEKRFSLNVVEVKADPIKHEFTRANDTYRHNHDLCCYINKVYPVEELKSRYKIWIAGLLQFQNQERKNRQVFEWQDGIIKFHPILDLTAEDVATYRYVYELPPHPLEAKGYGSVGCTHCTVKGKGRSGRWANVTKTECGLHQ